MRKINKGYTIHDIPKSLRLPDAANFEDGRIIIQARNTQIKREELIAATGYIYNDQYDSRYKLDDIKDTLIGYYHHKCAYCEQRIEQFHVEHYRPKRIYYWLAFSWDNLIVACPDCNTSKGSNFPIQSVAIAGLMNNTDINTQSHLHDDIEQPFMVNPEVTDPSGYIRFDKDGRIDSDDPRFYYTIRICKIDRLYLNDDRKKILDKFKEHLKAEQRINQDKNKLLNAIDALSRAFIREAENEKSTFLAFRKYAIDNWLRDEIKAILR